MTTEQEAKIEKAIAMMAADNDIKSLVIEIEKKIETTQNHYGDYMTAIATLAGSSRTMPNR